MEVRMGVEAYHCLGVELAEGELAAHSVEGWVVEGLLEGG